MLSFFDERFIIFVQGVYEKVMPYRRYHSQAVFPWGRTCPNLFVIPWIEDCGGVWNGNLGGLCYILFKVSNSFSTILNHIKHLTLIEFLIHKNVTPIGIHQNMLAFYGEDTEVINSMQGGVRKSWDSGKNVDLNDQFQSGSPVTAFHNLNSQKSQTFSRKLMNFGESHSGKAKHWLSQCQWDYCRF